MFHPEPPGQDLPLLGIPNVLLTPHLAARTYSAMENMSWVVKDVMAVLEGKRENIPHREFAYQCSVRLHASAHFTDGDDEVPPGNH